MTQETITTGAIFKAWLLFIFCSTIGGGIAGLILGGVVGGVMGIALGASGQSVESAMTLIRIMGAIAGFLAGLPISFLCYMWTVKRLVSRLQPAVGG